MGLIVGLALFVLRDDEEPVQVGVAEEALYREGVGGCQGDVLFRDRLRGEVNVRILDDENELLGDSGVRAVVGVLSLDGDRVVLPAGSVESAGELGMSAVGLRNRQDSGA